MAFTVTPAYSGEITYQNDSYASGDTLTAAALNSNFNEAKAQVNDNNSRIAALEATIVNLQSIIADLQGAVSTINDSNVMALNPYITVDTVSDARGPLVQLSGINLKLINGGGNTGIVNGLGNLIIGYDSARADSDFFCSVGYAMTKGSCAGASGVWAVSHKNGSHNLVIGDRNNYSSFGGMVVGYRNTINGKRASVSGGLNNNARTDNTSILGGRNNIAGGSASEIDGIASSISGGNGNTASGSESSVSGGANNMATGILSSILGGRQITESTNFGTSP